MVERYISFSNNNSTPRQDAALMNAIFQDQKYEFVMRVASGQTKLESIISWLENHIEKPS
ncbi:MAG: hypothetical protein CUR34_12950 [Sediminibacterium sp.]|nr:MAG: hypothetical protein CUR34_12950 [Sediminibacterium sp.] [Sediminibacterium sp. FEMGT703S]